MRTDGSPEVPEPSLLYRYVAAVLCVFAALAVRLALDPLVGSGQSLFAFSIAIMLAARIGGRGPGFLATALSVPVAWYFFLVPNLSLAMTSPVDVGKLVVLVVAGAGISLLLGRRLRSPNRATEPRAHAALLRQISFLFGAFLVLIVLTQLLYANFDREKKRHRWVTHSYQVLDAIQGLISNLQEAETGQRGYLLTGEERYREPFQSALREQRSLRRTLRELTAGDQHRQASLDTVDRLVESEFTHLQRTMASRRRNGIDFALAPLETAEGTRIMDEVRALLRALDKQDRALLATRIAAADSEDMRTRWITGLANATLLMLLVVAGTVIERDRRDHERDRQAASQSEQRFRMALDAARAGAWEWDLRTNQNVWSEELWNLYGLEPHSREPSYETWLQVVHPDDRAKTEQVVADAARAATDLNVEFRVGDPGGGERWLLSRGRPMLDSKGRAVAFAGIVLDITARRRAEEAILERERNLRRFTEFAPVSIAMFDHEMRYLAASRRFREDYSLGNREMIGLSHYDIFPEIPEHWRQIHRRCLAGAVERHAGEPFRRTDGSEQWIRWEIQPWDRAEGNIGGIVLFSEDITSQKQSDRALRESQEKLQMAHQAARIGTFEYDCRTKVTTWTPEMEALYGLPPGGFAAGGHHWESLLHPADREQTARLSQEALETGTFEAEWRVIRPDGSLRWLAGTARIFKDEAGMPLRLIGVNIDITGSKLAREALRQSEAALREAQRVARIGSWRWDAVSGAVSGSEELYNICSLDPHLPLPPFHDQEHLFTPESWQRLRSARLAAAQEGTSYEIDLELAAPGRRNTWATARGEAVRDAAGAIVALQGTVQDITRRKLAEEEIRARSAVIHAINEVFGRAVDCETEAALGRACLAIAEALTRSRLGFLGEINAAGRLDDMASHVPGRYASRLDEPAVQGIFGRVLLEGKGFYTNDPALHPDSIGVPEDHPSLTAFLGVPLLRDGKVLGMIAVANREGGYGSRDLEALEALAPAIVQAFLRRRAEEALRRASEQRRLAMEAAELGAWDYRFESGDVFWDEACRNMFGVPAGSRIAYDEVISCIHPDDAPATREAIGQAISGGAAYHREYRVVWPDSSVHWIASHGRVHLEGQSGRPVHLTGVNMDITDRKHAELEIRLLNTQLEQRVQQRTAQLETANHELEAFAHSVSHDLRAPLRGIGGWSQALAEDYAGQLDKRALEYLDRVRSETQRMGRLIDDMLHLSLVTRAQIETVPVDLSALACRLAAELRDANQGRRIEFAIAPGLNAAGDPRLLEIALSNLLANAVKFTGPRAQARIEFGRETHNGRPAFYVRDNGVGFDIACAGTLFKAFQRLHKTSEFPGTGIGLATVQRVVHRHAGRVWADAQVDRGATIFFTIGESSMNPHKNILLVEGNAGDAALARRALDKCHIANPLVVAADGEEALQYLFATGHHAARDVSDLPALVLLDFDLPKVPGTEVLRRIRSDPRTRPLPVVILTSFLGERDITAGHDPGINSYIRKPVDVDQLARCIEQLGLHSLVLNEQPPIQVGPA